MTVAELKLMKDKDCWQKVKLWVEAKNFIEEEYLADFEEFRYF